MERKLGMPLVELSLNISLLVSKPLRPYSLTFLICKTETRLHSPVLLPGLNESIILAIAPEPFSEHPMLIVIHDTISSAFPSQSSLSVV